MVTYSKQCILRHENNEDKAALQVAFIPAELAKFGTFVVIDGDVRVWKVIEVGAIYDSETLESHRKAWKQWVGVLS